MTYFRFQRAAPIGAALLLVACCCWSHLESASGLHAALTEKTARAAAAHIEATAEPVVDRDPFGVVSHPAHAVVHAAPKTSAPAPKARAADEPPPPFKLSATYACGRTKLAVIESHDYREGDVIKSGKEGEDGYLVAAILADRVVLRRHEQTMELTYADVAASPSGAAPVPATPKKSPAAAAEENHRPRRTR